jgi:hypothetical protein
VASASFQAQMAVAVIGGLVTSTGLTLVMVPATFTWIDDLERWVSRKIGHRWINSTSVSAAGAAEAAGAAPEPLPVSSAPAAASPAAQPSSGHARDLPGGPLPDAAR